MKDIKTIIQILPEIYSITKDIENSLNSDSSYSNSDDIKLKISMIYQNLEQLFGELPNNLNLLNEINIENILNWKNSILIYIFKQSFEYLKSIYTTFVSPAQINASEIKLFLQISNKLNMDSTTNALLLIFLSELCRTSDPTLSFNLIMEAFEIKPNLGTILGATHLKNYIYNSEIINQQKKIKNCTVCGGQGIPFHNAPSYKMINYNHNFLPAKLWMKCTECNNLYSQHFPLKFSIRKNPLKIIYPQQNQTQNLTPISTYILRDWCNILHDLKQFTKGKQILEIGIGNGALIATALEMNYDIDCIEIEEDVAQKISNLLECQIICCDFIDLPENKQYDILFMGDVLEHIDDPKKALKKAYKLLKNDGVLWISTPNYESSFNKLHKTSTALWNDPWHITYFNKNGLENLLTDLGFNILDYRISTHYNGSMEVIVNKKQG